jgi:hypothetical protein
MVGSGPPHGPLEAVSFGIVLPLRRLATIGEVVDMRTNLYAYERILFAHVQLCLGRHTTVPSSLTAVGTETTKSINPGHQELLHRNLVKIESTCKPLIRIEFLRGDVCDLLSKYLYAKPMPYAFALVCMAETVVRVEER